MAKNKATVIIDSKYNPKGTNAAKTGMQGVDKQTKATSANLLKASAVIAGVTIAYSAAKAKIDQFSKASAANEEIQSKFNTVFEDQARVVNEWADSYSDAVGRSTSDTLKFLASMKDLLTPMGFVQESAVSMSKEIVSLANDIGSFNDIPTANVIRDIQAAMTGGGETVKKYGVIVNVATTQQEALSSGIWDGTKAITAQQKAQAAWQLIVKGSSAAQGDLLRTQESNTNVTLKLAAALKDLDIILGDIANRRITPFRKALGEVVLEIVEWIQAAEDIKKPFLEMKDALEAFKNGTSTASQEILAHQVLLDRLRETYAIASKEDPSGLFEGREDALKGIEAQIAAKETLISVLKQELVLKQKGEKFTADTGEEETENAKELEEWLKKVNTAYALTQQGRKDALEASITMWEAELLLADKTAPKIQAVIDMYREQLKLMTDISNVSLDSAGLGPDGISFGLAKPPAAQKAEQESPLLEIIGEATNEFEALTEIISIVTTAMTILANPLILLIPIFEGLSKVILPALIEVLAPLIGILIVFGELIGTLLLPVIRLLIPPIRLLANIFVWLYNEVIRPFGNAVIGFIVLIQNGIIGAINALIKLINKIPGVSISKLAKVSAEDQMLQKISLQSITDTGTEFLGGTFETGADQTLLSGSRTTVQRVPDIFVHNNMYGDIYGAGGVAEFGEQVVKSIQAYVGVGGEVTFNEAVV